MGKTRARRPSNEHSAGDAIVATAFPGSMLAARSETVCTAPGMPARSLMLVSPVHVPIGQVLLLHAYSSHGDGVAACCRNQAVSTSASAGSREFRNFVQPEASGSRSLGDARGAGAGSTASVGFG
jgi:hypothetical protein